MGNHHSSTQAATTTVTAIRTATPAAPAALTSVASSLISSVPVIQSATSSGPVVSTSISVLSTQTTISTQTLLSAQTLLSTDSITVRITLTPAAVTLSPAVLTVTATPTPSTSSKSVYIEAPGALVGLLAGRLEDTPTGPSSSLTLTMASPTASTASSTPTTGLSTAGIVISGKKLIGPFAPPDAILGGIPTTGLDVPLTAVFLVLFLIGAATHFSIHEYNGKRGHKFHLSDAVFDFCMVRTVTCTMRIVWAFRPNNNSVVLAALIFENAGVVVLFAVNVILTQRMIRAINPNLGWHPIFNKFIMAIIISVPMIIVWNIVNLTVSFFTLNPHSQEVTKDLLLFGACWTLFLSLFPIICIGFLGFSNPYGNKPENFGLGSFTSKLIMIISASALFFVGAVIRLTSSLQVHPKDAPGPIDSKLVFYLTGFTLEIIVVYFYAMGRIDLRFWIPDGSSQLGDYSKSKSGFKLPGEDEEALFQEVDFKMRFSSGTDLPRDVKPQGMWESGDGAPTSARWRHVSGPKWQDMAVDRTNATREQVRQAIYDLKLNSELVGQPVSTGNGEELLVYAFRCRKGSFSDDGQRRGSGGSATLRGSGIRAPRKIAPPRTESWADRDRVMPERTTREMI